MTSTGGSPRDRVAEALRRLPVEPGSTILAALSGGPDSTALVHILHGLQQVMDFEVKCAHLDHGLREGAEREAESTFVRTICREMGLDLTEEMLPPGALTSSASANGRSLEEEARRIRYAFLDRTASAVGAGWTATGHTADDSVETIFMRILQGTDVTGLRGIPARRGRIIRPMIGLRRAEVEEYVRKAGLSPVRDSSNADPRFLRNRLRSRLLPVLERTLPGSAENVLSLAEKVGAHADFVAECARVVEWKASGDGLETDWFQFVGQHPVVRVQALYNALDELGDGAGEAGRQFPHRFVRRVMDVQGIAEKCTILSGLGYRLLRRREIVRLEPDVVPEGKSGYLVCVREEGIFAVPGTGLVLEVRSEAGTSGSLPGCTSELPFIVRSRIAGDRIRIHSGYKSLKSVYNEWKVPLERRHLIPVVVSGDEVRCILGRALGYADRCGSGDEPDPRGRVLVCCTSAEPQDDQYVLEAT